MNYIDPVNKVEYVNIRFLSSQDLNYIEFFKHALKNQMHMIVTSTQNSPHNVYISKALEELKVAGQNHSVRVKFNRKTVGKDLVKKLQKGLSQKSKKFYGSRGKYGTNVIIDDVNIPHFDDFGNIKVLEVLRCLREQNLIIDQNEGITIQIDGNIYLLNLDSNKKSYQVVPKNLLRNFFSLHISNVNNKSFMKSIFESINYGLPKMFIRKISVDKNEEIS